MEWFSHNLELCSGTPMLPVTNLAFSYGYGVYENIRVNNGQVKFLDEHLDRLFVSSKMLNINPQFTRKQIEKACLELTEKLAENTYNIKIILIGGDDQQLFVLPLKPKFVERKLYRDGAKVITTEFERFMPQVKSLNMLGSYMVYQNAMESGSYDALLVNKNGLVLEGSRTNFYALKGKTVFTADEKLVLAGVTRTHILDFAKKQGFEIAYQAPKLSELNQFDGFFISNTSSKLLPVSTIDNQKIQVSQVLQQLSKDFRDNY